MRAKPQKSPRELNMKLLALLFLVLAFTTKSLQGAKELEEVRDTSGNKTCPLDVVEEDDAMQFGFVPANFKKGVIRVSTDMNVIDSFPTNCSPSSMTVWKLDKVDVATRQRFVTTGSVQGNLGPETISNWFKIEKFESAYKLVLCPTVFESCKVVCKDIGIFLDENRNTHFALSDVPFGVKFQKACCE